MGGGSPTDLSCTGACTIHYQTNCPNTQVWVSGYLEGGYFDVQGPITDAGGAWDQSYDAPGSTQHYTGLQVRREGSSIQTNPINVTFYTEGTP
jgi:hypothetical protein